MKFYEEGILIIKENQKQMKKILLTVILIVITVCLPYTLDAEENSENIKITIQKLQPRVSDKRANQLAKYISYHSKASGVDPYLTTALIFRESSFSYAVQIGRRLGSPPQNCVGLMQIYPWGPAHKLGGYCNLRDADCNIRTGTMWLEYIHSICSDTTWQWIAAYGMRSCPTYYKARRNPATITARRIYCEISSDCRTLWPRKRE